MATLDWVFAAIVAISLAVGAWRGLVFEVLSLLGWVASFALAQWLAPDVAAWLPLGEAPPALRHAVGFVLVLVATVFLAALLSVLARKMIEAVGLRPVDRVLGAVFGALRGVVIVLAVSVVFQMTPLRDTQAWSDSRGAEAATKLLRGLKPMLPEKFWQYLPG